MAFMKKLLHYLVIFTLLFSTITFFNAGEAKAEESTSEQDPIKILVDGEEVTFDQPPVVTDGRTLVPVRGVFEKLGASVVWDGKTQSVKAIRKDKYITIKIGDTSPTVNGEAMTLDVPAQIINNRTLVPLRFISESLGADVVWDGKERTVNVYVWELIGDRYFYTDDETGEILVELSEEEYNHQLIWGDKELVNVSTWLHLLDGYQEVTSYHATIKEVNGELFTFTMWTEGKLQDGIVNGTYYIEVLDYETDEIVDEFEGTFTREYVEDIESFTFTILQALNEKNAEQDPDQTDGEQQTT
jgi:hypothetical protein